MQGNLLGINNEEMHEIESVVKGSIADEMGILPGDWLVSINGEVVYDVLDYRFKVQDEFLTVEILKPAPEGAVPEIWELELEKDPDEDLGLLFVLPLMSKVKICHNKCVFCFVDQGSPGLRDSLYVKDDDPRLSFLHGNYVTLTNLSQSEIVRLAGYHLSPLRISVHAADMDLRREIMANKHAGDLFFALDAFSKAGIIMHFQAVICKGLNDGVQLDYTIEKLSEIEGAASLAIVPAGLTRHRQGLFSLLSFKKDDAVAVIEQVEQWQRVFRGKKESAFVFLADEWYIMAEKELPAYDEYENFPQLDNGVGMLRLFEWEFINEKFIEKPQSPVKIVKIAVATGKAASKFMRGLANKFEELHPGAKIIVYELENNFFGEEVTVSGLMTGQDIIEQLSKRLKGVCVLFLPQNAFRAQTEDMLDGLTRENLEQSLGVSVKIGSLNGGEFRRQLMESL